MSKILQWTFSTGDELSDFVNDSKNVFVDFLVNDGFITLEQHKDLKANYAFLIS
jgi:hypothetical protein